MSRRMCKENYVLSVKLISPYDICHRLSLIDNSLYMNNIQGIVIIHLTYLAYHVIIYLTLWGGEL